jgi:hypothetical protein
MFSVLRVSYTCVLNLCLTADLATNEQQAEAQTFYEDLGTLAKENKLVNYTTLSQLHKKHVIQGVCKSCEHAHFSYTNPTCVCSDPAIV